MSVKCLRSINNGLITAGLEGQIMQYCRWECSCNGREEKEEIAICDQETKFNILIVGIDIRSLQHINSKWQQRTERVREKAMGRIDSKRASSRISWPEEWLL